MSYPLHIKITICLLLYLVSSLAFCNDRFTIWANHYYENIQHCATSTAKHTETKENTFIVELNIDPRWQHSLNRADQIATASWFAIHCPYAFMPEWKKFSTDFDIIIRGQILQNDIYSLSCRQHQSDS